MDQLPELLNFKVFIEHKNLTIFFSSAFNFTEAQDILQDFEDSLITLHDFSTVVLLTLYVPIFILGLIGNVLIIVSVSAEKVRKAKLYFMVNLALADLAVTVLCMPTSIGTIVYRLWVYGRFLCKFTAFIQGVAVAVSIFSMTAMSVDRYVALQHPVTHNRITSTNQSLMLILFMWIVAGIFMGPLIYIRDIDSLNISFLPPLPFCIENWPQDRDRQAYGVFMLFVVFIVPAFTIGVCYGHVGRMLCVSEVQRVESDGSTQRLLARKRAARMLIMLICAFMVCWLPYNVISALADITADADTVKALPFVLWLGHAHSAINPAMYWTLNKKFRESVKVVMARVKKNNCSSTSTISLPEYV